MCLFALVLVAASGLGVGASERLNVLFIAVDDLNDWTGSLGGHPQAATPNMDRLAGRGVSFSRAYAAAPACNPSRTSVLTGVRPSTSGVYFNHTPWRPGMKDAVTLPQHFMAHGYHVAGVGKIFHGRFKDPDSWNEYKAIQNFGGAVRKVARRDRSMSGLNRGTFDWGPIPAPDEEMPDMQAARWAAEYLGRDHDKPFFLAVGIFRPHLPWYVPQRYFDQFASKDVRLPAVKKGDLKDVPPPGRALAIGSGSRYEGDHAAILETDNWRNGVAAYLASIAFADKCVGQVLDALEKSPYAKNTVVVLWGDHGWHLGEKEHWRKFTLWEEATRTPLTIVAPGVTPKGATCKRAVSLLDLYPTLIELCGLKSKDALEGRSIVPLLKNPKTSWPHAAVTTHGRNNHAVRSERWRYIKYADGTEELYDHDRDPDEWTNLAGDPKRKEVKEELSAWLPAVNAEEAQ